MTRPDPCTEFRGRLERALEGRPMPEELRILSWHEHLLGCGACRELLEREEALEALLASMPDPHLDPDRKRRVLARLRSAREEADGLDVLLELDDAAVPAGLSARVLAGVRASAKGEADDGLDALLALDAAPVPAGLAGRVLAGVRANAAREADERLDALLELDRELHVPANLAERVLAFLESERLAPLRRFPSPRFLLAAAAVLAFVALPLWWPDEKPARPDTDRVASAVRLQPDAELRAFLEEGGLEILDEPLLWAAEEDLEIALAASLDPRYETVIDYDEPAGAGAESGR